MKLAETTELILSAAEALDLAALESAGALRDTAIAALASASPTPELCAEIAASIAAGEKAKKAMDSIRRRSRDESRRLTQIESGFLRVQLPKTPHKVDCRA